MGMNGSAVQSVQYMLMDTGYLAGGADGIFGSATEDAVKRFQADYGLDVDGIVGSQTMAALSEASGREAPAEEGVGSYQRRIVMDASAYTADDPGNSGFTATGLRLRRGMVSVDPDVIPLGSQLYIEGYGYATAEDTGRLYRGQPHRLGHGFHYGGPEFRQKRSRRIRAVSSRLTE